MKKTLVLIFAYLRHNLMAAMEYRAAFILQAVGMALNNLVFLFFWWLLFTHFPSLHGWTLPMVISVYGLVAMSVGLSIIIFGNSMRVASLVVNGDLDYYLALPADPLVHLLVSRMGLSAWGDALSGLAIFLFLVPGSLVKLPLFLFCSVCGALIFTSFCVIVGALVFFVNQSQDISSYLYSAMITFSLYPTEIFGWGVRVLLYTLLPAAMLGTFPGRLLFEFQWWRLGALAGFALLLVVISYGLFNLGLRRYESGNRVTMRG